MTGNRDRTAGPARRFLARELRSESRLREDPDLRAVLEAAVTQGDLTPIGRLDPRSKRLLLEILDERVAHRPVRDPAALVRVTQLLMPSALSAPRPPRTAVGPAR